jgi:pre-mRNA cleavage complex 2 protein Pcf11
MSGYAWPSGYSNPVQPNENPGPTYYAQQHLQQSHQDYYRSPPPPPQSQPYYGQPPPVDYYSNRGGGGGGGYGDNILENDPNEFRRYFVNQLNTLTFNSRPIINSLSLLARQHYVRMQNIIATALEDHLRNCDPSIRLPALYLLDSIAKNTGQPYISLFARFVERTFLSMYHEADDLIRIKMEELLGTWRTGGSNRGELFRLPEEGDRGRIQHAIETALFGSGGRGGGMANGGRSIHDSDSYLSGVSDSAVL